jgi:hypothetical protein
VAIDWEFMPAMIYLPVTPPLNPSISLSIFLLASSNIKGVKNTCLKSFLSSPASFLKSLNFNLKSSISHL